MTADLIATIGLFLIFLIVLIVPFRVRMIEENLEVFLFINGVIALTLAGFIRIPGETTGWSGEIVTEALMAPIRITDVLGVPVGIVQIVLVVGLAIYFWHSEVEAAIAKSVEVFSLPATVCILIVVLGLTSSIISAIIAAIVLVEMLCVIPLSRGEKVNVTVISCFSIGLGAALTPLGEPLSTIAVSKLSGPPYYAGFGYLASTIGYLIIPGVLIFGVLGYLVVRKGNVATRTPDCSMYVESVRDIVIRAGKVYLFIMALIFLGDGFKPLIIEYVTRVPPEVLYWVNMVSAILDNATLASAEIGPSLSELQIKSALTGLLVSGGMLIPGNIPNIISAGKLKISSKEWAKAAVPIGMVAMVIYFIALFAPVYLGIIPA